MMRNRSGVLVSAIRVGLDPIMTPVTGVADSFILCNDYIRYLYYSSRAAVYEKVYSSI